MAKKIRKKADQLQLNAGDVYLLILIMEGAKLTDQGNQDLEKLKQKLKLYLRKKLKY